MVNGEDVQCPVRMQFFASTAPDLLKSGRAFVRHSAERPTGRANTDDTKRTGRRHPGDTGPA